MKLLSMLEIQKALEEGKVVHDKINNLHYQFNGKFIMVYNIKTLTFKVSDEKFTDTKGLVILKEAS